MLGTKDVAATIAVRDLQAASRFYEGTLGMRREAAEGSEAIVYKSGASTLLVYVSEFAGTNKATAATWTVGADLEGIVRDLASRGVAFEHYDLPGTARKGDVHVAGRLKMAWLKDPDGNVLALVSE